MMVRVGDTRLPPNPTYDGQEGLAIAQIAVYFVSDALSFESFVGANAGALVLP
jgi:hypothetical protein